MAGARFPGAVRLLQQRRRAGDEEAHVRRRPLGEVVAVEQARVEGRHAHHHRRVRHRGDHRAGLEFRQEDHRGAGAQHRVGGDEEPVGVVDRQRVQ